MSRVWRWVVPLTAAAGLLAATAAIPAEASTPGYSVTIAATSPNYPGNSGGLVDGHAVVVYADTYRGLDLGVVSGVVTGYASGDVVTLLAEPFKATSFKSAGSQTLTTSGSYTFTVKPSLATKYEVEVSTGSTVDVTSAVQTVYVSSNNGYTGVHKKCDFKTNTCTYSYKAFFYVPAAAYKVESHKALYLYLAQWYVKGASPTWYYLDKNVTVSKVTKVNRGTFRYTLTFFIRLRSGENYWNTFYCTKDTESKDGLGLPGRHGCGNKRLNADTLYVG